MLFIPEPDINDMNDKETNQESGLKDRQSLI